MKFTCNQQTLAKALNTVSKAVSSRTTIPILKGIMIKASEEGKLILTASDLEISIKKEIEANVEEAGAFVVMAALAFFAFTTILGWDYYSETCLEYIVNGRMGAVKVYRWLYILAVLIGPFITVSAVWQIADIFNGLMAIPNMAGLFVLSGVVRRETLGFFTSGKHLDRLPDHK